MPNRRRGEVALQLGETRYTLCLTLARVWPFLRAL